MPHHYTVRRERDITNLKLDNLIPDTCTIEVVYALSTHQRVVAMTVPAGTTARQAALQSGLDRFFPEIKLAELPIGLYGERVADDYQVREGDRVELYRPLLLDPMEARRRRAARQ